MDLEKWTPVAAALWVSVSEEVEKRLKAGETRLKPQEWKSGDRLWLIELIAPGIANNAKAVQALLGELAKTVFGGRGFRLRRLSISSGALTAGRAFSAKQSAEQPEAGG